MDIPHLPSLMFYVFAALTLFSAIMVISSKNPVHSVLFLIFTFFNAAGLFVLLGAEYIAMSLVIVYVGAVAVLFLFVVMMLDIDIAAWRQGFVKNLPLGLGVALLLFAQLGAMLYAASLSENKVALASQATPDPAQISNTKAIGHILYTDYAYAFIVSGVILLIAMVGAIVLTHRQREGVRRQVIAKQVVRTKEQSIAIVKVQPGEGA